MAVQIVRNQGVIRQFLKQNQGLSDALEFLGQDIVDEVGPEYKAERNDSLTNRMGVKILAEGWPAIQKERRDGRLHTIGLNDRGTIS